MHNAKSIINKLNDSDNIFGLSFEPLARINFAAVGQDLIPELGHGMSALTENHEHKAVRLYTYTADHPKHTKSILLSKKIIILTLTNFRFLE